MVGATPQIKLCSVCNQTLVCGATQTGELCWCVGYPAIMPIDIENDCLCETCLNKAIIEKRNKYPNTEITEDFTSN
jgi:hypothetical protein